jgi:hypothetical protein
MHTSQGGALVLREIANALADTGLVPICRQVFTNEPRIMLFRGSRLVPSESRAIRTLPRRWRFGRNGRVAYHPPGTRTNGSSMRALDFLQHLRTALLDLPVVTALASVPLLIGINMNRSELGRPVDLVGEEFP